MNAIVILCLQPHKDAIVFFELFRHVGYDVYILVDDNSWEMKKK